MNLRQKIEAEASKADEGWGAAYPLFSRVINEYGLKVGVEIGVAFGGHSDAILRQTRIEKLYGVDPYKHFDDYDDPMNLPQPEFDALYEFTNGRLAKHGERFEPVRDISVVAATKINIPIDFVYIDALHTYEGVRDDLRLWFPKVRDGGIVGGHDYGHPNFPGVKRAVDEFFLRFGWSVHDEGEGVWWVKKQPLRISFIVPAYNCESTITETLDSILDGNMDEGDEIVVVDDCSIDGTRVLLDDYAKTHGVVRVVSHARNKGGAAARNTAVENAVNELIFCVDSDNILERSSVPNLKRFLVSEGAHAAAFQELRYFTNNKDEITHRWIFQPGVISFADCLASTIVPISSGNYLYTKESWRQAGGYPEYAKALDAWGFGFRQLAMGQKFVVLENTGYRHRHGHESYWIREGRNGKTSYVALQILIPFLDMLKKTSTRYVLSERGRRSWFENLERKPLRIKRGRVGVGGVVVDASGNRLKHRTLLRRAILRLKNAMGR